MKGESWTPDTFEALFRASPDPWRFETSPYEHEKLAHLLACIPHARPRFAVEVGCATGVGTRMLAARCGRVLAIDASATALAMARRRCGDMGHVSFVESFVPGGYPASRAAGCDLIVLSELLYFLGRDDIQRLAACVTDSVTVDGALVLANWTGPTDTPCTGDEAAGHFIAACRERLWVPDLSERTATYRIDRLRHVSQS